MPVLTRLVRPRAAPGSGDGNSDGTGISVGDVQDRCEAEELVEVVEELVEEVEVAMELLGWWRCSFGGEILCAFDWGSASMAAPWSALGVRRSALGVRLCTVDQVGGGLMVSIGHAPIHSCGGFMSRWCAKSHHCAGVMEVGGSLSDTEPLE